MILPGSEGALPKAGRRSAVVLTRDFDGAKIRMDASKINFLVPKGSKSRSTEATYIISDEFNEFVRETPQQVLELIYRESPYA